MDKRLNGDGFISASETCPKYCIHRLGDRQSDETVLGESSLFDLLRTHLLTRCLFDEYGHVLVNEVDVLLPVPLGSARLGRSLWVWRANVYNGSRQNVFVF